MENCIVFCKWLIFSKYVTVAGIEIARLEITF